MPGSRTGTAAARPSSSTRRPAMSLGGNATWYAMACAPWIAAGAPVCGGVGSLARVIHQADIERHSAYYFVPGLLRHFDHENVINVSDLLEPTKPTLTGFNDIYIVSELMETDLHRVIYSRQKLSDDHITALRRDEGAPLCVNEAIPPSPQSDVFLCGKG